MKFKGISSVKSLNQGLVRVRRRSDDGQVNIRLTSGESQVNLNLSLTLVDVKLVALCFTIEAFSGTLFESV